MTCLRGRGELEIHIIDKRSHAVAQSEGPHPLSLSVLPTALCGAARDANNQHLRLPCPRDPSTYLRYFWSHAPHYTACLALPMDRRKQTGTLSAEDIEFLWRRSQDLHSAGSLSMGSYYADCREHPQAEMAQSRYWRNREWT